MSKRPCDDDRDDGPHPFVYPDDPTDLPAAKKAYDDETSARILERLKKLGYSRRGRWRPVK
jgi:hypothetical protein